VLNFVCAEINYGGRVTDGIDKRLISTILKTYMTPEIMQDYYPLCPPSQNNPEE
jgi:dynein heavy chain